MSRRYREARWKRFRARLAMAMSGFAALFALMWAVSLLAPFYVSRNLLDPIARELTGHHSLWVDDGRVSLQYFDGGTAAERSARTGIWEIAWAPAGPPSSFSAPAWLRRIGIDWEWFHEELRDRRPVVILSGVALSAPFWLLILVTGSTSYLVGRRNWSERRRLRRGECQACGYDLRATPDRCPECGLAVTRG